LGEAAEAEMQALGSYAKSKGIERLVATGTALPIAEGYGADAQYFPTHDEVCNFLNASAREAEVILVKGSRSAQMDRVINTLKLQQGGQ
jgi:UDP-N-acetylmuramoyl-tripeptide--D-alanyl-D-alanine ligase